MNASRKLYLDGPYGQIHVHIWGQPDAHKPIVFCMPPSPYSGRAYATIAPYLTQHAQIVAMDYPQIHGDKKPSIKDYALCAEAVVDALCGAHDSFLLGFHTGSLVAAEATLNSTLTPAKIILIDVPYFSKDKQNELRALSIGSLTISDSLSDLQPAWDMSVTRQDGRVSPERALSMFADHVSAGAASGDPFAAAFNYDCAAQFKKLKVPCDVIATKAGLYEETLEAAKMIPSSELIEELSIEASVLEQAAAKTAKLIIASIANSR